MYSLTPDLLSISGSSSESASPLLYVAWRAGIEALSATVCNGGAACQEAPRISLSSLAIACVSRDGPALGCMGGCSSRSQPGEH